MRAGPDSDIDAIRINLPASSTTNYRSVNGQRTSPIAALREEVHKRRKGQNHPIDLLRGFEENAGAEEVDQNPEVEGDKLEICP